MRMKVMLFIALLYWMCTGPLFANYLINGDGESGNFSGWVQSGDNILQTVNQRQQTTGIVYPAEGNYFFSYAKLQGAYAKMSQTGLVNATDRTLTLGGLFQGEYTDYGIATLNIYNPEGVRILSKGTGSMTSEILTWTAFEISAMLPENSYAWEVTLEGFLTYGSYVNVFYDNVYLVPEPVTLSLLASYWLNNCTSENNYCDGADMNHSRVVDLADWAIFAENWLREI